MGTRRRLDAELVRRGLARSREQAAELVAAGRVVVAGQSAGKPATQVTADDPIAVAGRRARARSTCRGAAHKLAGALAAFPGLSRGGPALPGRGRVHRRLHRRAAARRRGAGGRGGRRLRPAGLGAAHRRPGHRARPGQRPRTCSPAQVAPPPDLVIADLSFISLQPGAARAGRAARPRTPTSCCWSSRSSRWARTGRRGRRGARPGAAGRGGRRGGRGRRGRSGSAWPGVTASPLPGPSGNVEYFLWLRRGAPPLDDGPSCARVIAEGPQ